MNTFEWQENGPGESGRADKAIFDHYPRHAEESVLVQTTSQSTRGASFKAAVRDIETRLAGVKHVSKIESPYAAENAGQISKDGRSALVDFQLAGEFDAAEKRVDGPGCTVARGHRRRGR